MHLSITIKLSERKHGLGEDNVSVRFVSEHELPDEYTTPDTVVQLVRAVSGSLAGSIVVAYTEKLEEKLVLGAIGQPPLMG